jgi:hypothetical protein
MIQKWLISAGISFMLRQLAKWQKSIDWAKVKADLAARIAALVPGEFLDEEVVQIVMGMVDAAAAVLASSEELEKIIKLVLDQKFQEAWAMLRDLILGQWVPSSPAQEKALACIKDCEVL